MDPYETMRNDLLVESEHIFDEEDDLAISILSDGQSDDPIDFDEDDDYDDEEEDYYE